jgi:peptidoglycan/LPS O-acetylase OafA/YrhL
MYRVGPEDIGAPRTAGDGAPPASDANFYPRIEALRGIAALAVAAMHSWQSTWLDSTGTPRIFLTDYGTDGQLHNAIAWLFRAVGNGHGAVILFFVISGFVLTGSLQRGPQSGNAAAARFVVSRLFRLYPAVFATIALFAVVFWTTGGFINARAEYSAISLIRNALLLDTSISGIMWTLQVELLAVPLLLLAYWLSVRFGIGAVIALCCVLTALSFSGHWNRPFGGTVMLGSIYAFVAGMVAFLVAPRLVKSLTSRTAALVFTGAAAGFFASRPVLGWASNWSVVAETAFGAVTVGMLAFGRPGGLAKIFDGYLARFFGRISYSFYLLHPLTLIVMWKIPATLGGVIAAGVPPTVVAIVLFAVSTAAITPLAVVMYRWVEQPGIAANRRLAKRIAAAAPSAASTAS